MHAELNDDGTVKFWGDSDSQLTKVCDPPKIESKIWDYGFFRLGGVARSWCESPFDSLLTQAVDSTFAPWWIRRSEVLPRQSPVSDSFSRAGACCSPRARPVREPARRHCLCRISSSLSRTAHYHHRGKNAHNRTVHGRACVRAHYCGRGVVTSWFSCVCVHTRGDAALDYFNL